MRTFLGAVSFLTIIRTPGPPVAPGRAAGWFPLVGAILGAAGAGVFIGGSRILPLPLAALLAVAFWVTITGVLHEDGLADIADALRAGRTREKMLSILKDSRIGTFGAVAVVLSVIARWQALEHIPLPRALEACIAAQAVPRGAMVALAWISRPAGSGLGDAFTASLTTPAALVAIAQGIAAAMLCGLRPALMIIAASYIVVRIAQWYFYRRIGGINGDCLGATEQILEMLVLISLVAHA